MMRMRIVLVALLVALELASLFNFGLASPSTVPAFLWSQHLQFANGEMDEAVNYQYDSYLSKHDGSSNAYTEMEHTCCHFEVKSGSELKNKHDGWESTAKEQDGNLWEMSQREEDIFLQVFDRRIAFCKFQIASFIKQHIFSRRRLIDGWRYMIEVIGPNARKGKGSVSRLPA